VNASDLLTGLVAPGTFRSWDADPVDVRPDAAYAADLAAARHKTGLDESVITGEGLIGGRRAGLAACEFGFLGGSIGVAAGERLARAVERATAEGLPMIALPASGGTRMQEGTAAFLQMVNVTAAVEAHKAAHLPYLVYLRDPTMGGVFASWGSLGHLTLAEPGALIGFLGPRVYHALYGSRFPEGVQTSENLHAHGLIDAIVPPGELAGYVDRVLTAITAEPSAAPASRASGVSGALGSGGSGSGGSGSGGSGSGGSGSGGSGSGAVGPGSAWGSVLRTRASGRPGAADLIRLAATNAVFLGRTGLILALARIGGYPCVLIAQDRHGPPLGPAALRLARRGVRLAAGLALPLVSVIDTPGPELSARAEEDGLAREIAGCLADLVTVPVPTVSLLLGQGTGGAALAMLPADRILAAEHAWLAPLPPEGASAIVYRDTGHAPELAELQGIRSADLAARGVVDFVIPEEASGAEGTPGANRFCRDLGRALHRALEEVAHCDEDTRFARRVRRYRHLGGTP
jgi:acyl-CoA carboxylase subunit beta